MKAAELFDLKGRVALVTGASGGLGLRFAEVLAANGASVALVARRADKLKAAVAKIEKAGGKAIAVEADVLDRAAMNRAFDQAEKALGTVTILVNNAGVAHSTRAIDVTEDEWNRVVRTNLDAVFFWAQEGARRMLAADKKGAIVNIASVLGFGVSKGTIAYATAKAGVIQMTKALGNELAFKGVRVNAIAPGWFVTDINRDYLSSEHGQEAHPRHSGRPLRPGRRSRRRAAAAGVGCRRLHGRRDRRLRRRPDGRAAGVGGIMDFTLSPEIEYLRVRTRAFVEEHVLPLESDPMNFAEHENIPDSRLAPVREKAKAAGPVGAAVAEGIRRHGPADGRLGGDVRGGRALAVRPARVQLHGAGRRQHERAEEARHAGAEGKVAAAHRRRQGALVVRDDRTRARRRLRSRA